MSVAQYQQQVNSLDREIADLERKKAIADRKAADEEKKAQGVSISKNASALTVKSKLKQIDSYKSASQKASAESAALQKKIAEKREKRNAAYLKLQKEEANDRKKEQQAIKRAQQAYERKITEIETSHLPHTVFVPSQIREQAIASDYDVFISHAWEDKNTIADELVQALKDRNVSVWYDTSSMKWGDSMRSKIDEGLRHSKFGIVILSPNYIAEGKYWTKTELDGLFQMESVNGKMLLPIWHNLTKKEVMDYSPIIAGRLAMNTASMTPEEIAEKLVELLQDTEMGGD